MIRKISGINHAGVMAAKALPLVEPVNEASANARITMLQIWKIEKKFRTVNRTPCAGMKMSSPKAGRHLLLRRNLIALGAKHDISWRCIVANRSASRPS